ncbi:MAG: hypothetical protein ACRELX_08905, partial [Longimicrobiales bacterium]
MLRIVRRGDRHDPRELTVSLRFEGDFSAAFREGHAEGLVPGEPLKNLVHGAARQHAAGDIERFGLALCSQILGAHARITRVRVEIVEQPWARMEVGGKAQGQAFIASGPELRTAAVTSNREQVAVVSGIDHLVVMRTAGFVPRGADDELRERMQPLVVGTLSARWTYTSGDVTFGPYRQVIRSAILDTFALHASRSVHYTLYAIADVVLASHDEIADITLSMHE